MYWRIDSTSHLVVCTALQSSYLYVGPFNICSLIYTLLVLSILYFAYFWKNNFWSLIFEIYYFFLTDRTIYYNIPYVLLESFVMRNTYLFDKSNVLFKNRVFKETIRNYNHPERLPWQKWLLSTIITFNSCIIYFREKWLFLSRKTQWLCNYDNFMYFVKLSYIIVLSVYYF